MGWCGWLFWIAVVGAGVGEYSVDRPADLGDQQRLGQRPVDEVQAGHGPAQAQQRLVAVLPRPGWRGAGGQQRVVAAGPVVGVEVFHRVQQVRDPAEHLAGPGQRWRVVRLGGQGGGVAADSSWDCRPAAPVHA